MCFDTSEAVFDRVLSSKKYSNMVVKYCPEEGK